MNGAKRWLYAFVSIITLIFLGLIYAWSVFVIPLEVEFGWTRAQTSLTFSISMAFFCLGGLLSGVLSKKISHRILLFVGGCSIFLGFFLLSHANCLLSLYLFYGVFAGIGVGIGYNAIMSLIVKWFSDMAGLLSGLLLMAFGFGGYVLGSVFAASIARIGWRSSFLFSGIIIFIVLGITAMIIRQPPQLEENKSGKNFTTKEMLHEKSFYSYYGWAILLSSGGLALIGNAAPFASSFLKDAVAAASIAGLISISNGVGRLAFGLALDRFGISNSMKAISFGFLIGSLTLFTAVLWEKIWLLIPGFCLVGFFYGAVTSTNSAFISRSFGTKHFSMNFSLITTNLLFSSFLGPAVAGVLQSDGQYFNTTIFLVILAILALLMIRISSVVSCNQD